MEKETRIMIAVFVAAAIIVGGVYFFVKNEASLSQDGTIPPKPGDENVITLSLNQRGEINDVFLTPLAILEDSRCPADVVCIQMGTVRLKVRVESGLGVSEMEMRLNESITTEAEEVTLATVLPAVYSSQERNQKDYRFMFTVTKRPPMDGGVPIQSRNEYTIVYGMDASNMDLFRAHCAAEGGRFDECGSACKPGAEICATVCVVKCYLTPQ